MLFDHLQHITTLSTGSIVVLVTFLHEIFKQPEWKWAVAMALASFAVSTISCVAAQAGVIEITTSEEDTTTWGVVLVGAGSIVAWVSFLVGTSFLAVFALKNLF